MLSSEKIETVRKENMFGEEVTESEMDIIQKRVALQQRQFQEFEKREYKRKSIKIKGVYDYLSDEEISEMLVDCSHDEVGVLDRKRKLRLIELFRKKSSSVSHNLPIFWIFVERLLQSMLLKLKYHVR